MNEFYVYQLRLENSQFPFYIGKGKGNRVEQHFTRSSLRAATLKNNIIKKAQKAGQSIVVEKLAVGLAEGSAFSLERYLIASYGRRDAGTGILANMTDGGEGGSGYIPTPEKRAAVSRALTGKIVSAETGRKISSIKKGMPGKPRTAEDRAAISAKLKGVLKSPETIAKMKAAWELRRLRKP